MDITYRQSRLVTLLAAAARTASVTGSGVVTNKLYVSSSGPMMYLPTGALLILEGSLSSGTVDVVVEGSLDGTNWFPLPLSSAFTQVTTVATTHKQTRTIASPVIPAIVRATFTGASTPVYNLSLKALLPY